MSSHVPLSLRRKIVVALDAEYLQASARGVSDRTADETIQLTANRFASFKTLA
ncbi:hypothetical protein J3F80_002251, partial [Coemansia sp. RSA 2526]